MALFPLCGMAWYSAQLDVLLAPDGTFFVVQCSWYPFLTLTVCCVSFPVPPVRPPMMRPTFVPHILQRPGKVPFDIQFRI